MARNAHERPNVTAARAQSGEERMAGRIKDKGRDLRRLERVAMLLFDGTVIHMPFLGWGRPYPTACGLALVVPTSLEHANDAGRHRNTATCGVALSLQHENRTALSG